MAAFLLRRAAMLVAVFGVVSVLAFLIPLAGAGDPARAVLQARTAEMAADDAALAAVRRQLGLEAPLAVRYGRWLADVARGELGRSFTDRRPVGPVLLAALGVSMTLAATALVVALLLAVPLGTVAALHRGRALDGGITVVTQCFVAVPEYWLAPVGVLVFALHLGWLPSAGWDRPASLVLPALVLVLRPLAYFTAVTRAAMVDVLAAPYMAAARSRGLGLGGGILRHGLRNAAVPVVTLSGLWLAGLVGGAVVVEVIFGIPGMGRLVYEAVVNKDMPVLQGGLLCIAGLAVVITGVVDVCAGLLDPRIGRAG